MPGIVPHRKFLTELNSLVGDMGINPQKTNVYVVCAVRKNEVT